MDQETPPVKCEKCGAYKGHAVDCPDLTLAMARVMIVQAWEGNARDRKVAQQVYVRLKGAITFWNGKFKAVKHENNQLRKQVNRWPHRSVRLIRALRVVAYHRLPLGNTVYDTLPEEWQKIVHELLEVTKDQP